MEPPGSMQDGVVNMTRAMEALSPWLNNPRRTIIQVQALVVAAAALLLLQLILGSCKRRWHNSIVKGGLSLCNELMFPLILYTLSKMQSSPIKNSTYPVWIVFLLMASTGTTAVHQYDFHESLFKKNIKAIVEVGRFYFYVVMANLLLNPNTSKVIWGLKVKDGKMTTTPSSICVVSLIVFVFLEKCFEAVWFFTLQYSKRRLTLAAGTMDNPCDSDPESMNGFNYVVFEGSTEAEQITSWMVKMAGGTYKGECITVGQIWRCCGNSDNGQALKDICLSYALYRQILTRRYFGVVCPEPSRLKTHHFFFKNLLPSEEHYERAFRIIKVELGFCYDFFFTKYRLVFLSIELIVLRIFVICFVFKIILLMLVGVFTFRKSLVLETPDPIIEVYSTEFDYTITLLLIAVALIVELLQSAIYLASDWVQISLAFRYVKKNCCAANAFIEKAIGFIRSVIISGQLRNKMSQYSVIFPSKKGIFGWKHSSVEVSDIVKRAIASSLMSTGGNLTNGETSLRNNRMFGKYCWTFKDHSQLEIMLIWHIATEYCDISDGHRDEISQDERSVAVNLSRYCAYLIISVAELLPYHKVDITELTEKVTKERDDLFGNHGRSERYINQMNNLLQGTREGDKPMTVFTKGVKLGKQLKSMPDEDPQCWKVMADFWAETIIYVAPSHSTVKEHMQHLENGGEFLTHIWALLSHAGILNLNRDKDQGAREETV